MKWKKDLLNKRWFSYAAALCIAVVVYLVLSHIDLLFVGLQKFGGFVRPVLYGVIIAYIMDPLVKVFEKYVFRGVKSDAARRNLSVLTAVVGVIVAIVFLMVALIPQLVNSVITLFENIEGYAGSFQKLLENLESASSGWRFDISSILNTGENLIDSLLENLPQNLDTILKTTVSFGQGIAMGVIGCIIAIYFLVDKKRLLSWFANLIKLWTLDRNYKEIAAFWKRCNYILIRYIICDILDGVIVGAANAIFMMIVGIPYAAVISVVVGVTNLAPTFGPIVGGAIGAFILVLINPWYALWFLIFTVIIQTIDGYVIKPKFFGSTLGVSGVWILICLVVGANMFGISGILLAIPFAAISDFIYNEYLLVKLKNRKERREKEREENSRENAGDLNEGMEIAGDLETADPVKMTNTDESL